MRIEVVLLRVLVGVGLDLGYAVPLTLGIGKRLIIRDVEAEILKLDLTLAVSVEGIADLGTGCKNLFSGELVIADLKDGKADMLERRCRTGQS